MFLSSVEMMDKVFSNLKVKDYVFQFSTSEVMKDNSFRSVDKKDKVFSSVEIRMMYDIQINWWFMYIVKQNNGIKLR